MHPKTIDMSLLKKAISHGNIMVFCGAGVSMLAPSNAPSWWGIYRAASEALLMRFREFFPEFEEEISIDDLLSTLSTQALADLIIREFAGETFVNNLRVVDVADPNENHRLLVALAAKGHLCGLITTNFDTMIERAASVYGSSFNVVTPGSKILNADPASSPLLAKLHGTSVDSIHLVETLSQKAKDICHNMEYAWQQAIPGNDLLVIGYSGADLNFGAARAFFLDFLKHGGRIWWLYRPSEKPTLLSPFKDRVTFILGSLPELLRELAEHVDVVDFETPITHRDAQAELTKVMDSWSKELHIGPWSAAIFLLALATEGKPNVTKTTLERFLFERAKSEAEKLKPGDALSLENLSLTGFFQKVAIRAFETTDFQGAASLQRAAINIYEAFHKMLDGKDHQNSKSERHMNLSSAWCNYGHSLVTQGKLNDGAQAFMKAIQNAYLAERPEGFLIALHNLIHYVGELKQVRRDLSWVRAGIRIADRYGAVQSSIELRFLAVMFHLDRNEIWVADSILSEAKRRANAAEAAKFLTFVSILEGFVFLKRGMIKEGLNHISNALTHYPKSAFFYRPIEEVRRHLEMLGLSQNAPYQLDLPTHQIPSFIDTIEGEIHQAKSQERIPWKGRHCGVSSSSGINDEDAMLLFQLGIFEFDGNAKQAIALDLHRIRKHLETGYFGDVIWSAENLLARPELSHQVRGYANGLLAGAYASLGRLNMADNHLRNAETSYADADEIMPCIIADIGLWFFIQQGNSGAAIHWARYLARALVQEKLKVAMQDVANKIGSWGSAMEEVGLAFRETLEGSGHVTKPEKDNIPKEPFSRFTGASAVLNESHNEATFEAFQNATEALKEGQPDRALEVIDTLVSNEEAPMPDHHAGIASAIQIYAFSEKIDLEKLSAFMDHQRNRYLSQFAFSALTHLETAFAWVLLKQNQVTQAKSLIHRAFIGEFGEDAKARAGLWSAVTAVLRSMGQQPEPKILTEGEITLRFFPGEAHSLTPILDNQHQTHPHKEVIGSIFSQFQTAMANAKTHTMVDEAIRHALKSLKKHNHCSRKAVARIRGERANWALRMLHFEEARRHYRKAGRALEAVGDSYNALNSLAGEARAWSHEGHYTKAVAIFKQALAMEGSTGIKPNLLLGLGATHLLEAQHNEEKKADLLISAIKVYKETIDSAPLWQKERPFARLGMARALGEKGDQEHALRELDTATSELAHLGSPAAKILIENRPDFEAGEWYKLGLF